MGGATPFDLQGFSGFRGGIRCDPDGNVFLLPDQPGARERSNLVLRASADGKVARQFGLSLSMGQTDSAPVTIQALALDPNGSPYALTTVGATEDRTRQYIVSLTSDGEYRSKIEIPRTGIHAYRFAVFSSGEFLLSGLHGSIREGGRPRLAVMRPDGSLRDVIVPRRDDRAADEESMLSQMSQAASSRDGRIYFAPSGGPVYEVDPSGEITATIPVSSPKPDARLIDLRLSASRLAAIFNDKDQPVRWISVYDIGTQEETAAYGPVQQTVLCYSHQGGYDRFALLGGQNGRLVRFTASYP